VSVKVTVGQQTFIKKIVLGTPVTTARETLSIDEFTDFDVATKSDAQILVFDSSEGVFKNFTFDVGQGLAREYSPGDDKLVIAIDSDKTPVVTGILSKGNLTPTLDSTFDLGDSNRKWKDLHLSGSTIHLGGIKLKDSGGDFSVKDSTGTAVNIDLAGSVQQIRGFFSPGGDLSYDSTTGRFEFDVEQVYTKANFDSDLGDALDGGVGIAYDSATDTIRIDSAELEANFKQDIRGYFSSSNSLNYNSTTGDFRLPQPLDSAARATFQKVIIPDGGLGGDSARITFGSDSDLKIFHNGSHSVIRDAGTGSLQLQTNNLAVQNATGTENQITALSGGAVSLFFNNLNKLATTDSGVTVTGSIRGDSATVPLITADSALITDISGSTLNYASINAAVASVDSARVTNVSGTNLNYASIHGAVASIDSAKTTNISGTDLNYTQIHSKTALLDSATLTNVTADSALITDISGSTLNYASINGAAVTADSARITNVSGTNLNYASIHGSTATIDSAVITNLSGSSANFTTLHSRSTTIDSAHIDALSGDSARFNDLHADSAHITNLTAATINFNDINIDSADISILSGDSAKITNISGTDLNYTKIHSKTALLDSATLTNITADSALITDISGTTANYASINGAAATLDSARVTNISGSTSNFASVHGAAATFDSAVVTNISGSSSNYALLNAAAATIDSAKVTNISGTSANYGTLNGIYQGFDSDLARTTSRQTIRTYFNIVDAGGDGSFAYDSAIGQFTYTGPSSSEVRAHLSASNSLSYDNSTGDFRLPQPLDSSANPTFNQLRGPASFVIDPATIGDNTGTVRILGNLQVEGTQTIINSTTVSLNDKNIVIADSAADSSALDGGGITWGGASVVDNPSFNYSHADARLVSNRELNAPLFSGSGASLTNLPSASLTGTIDSARIPTLLIADIGNIPSIDHDALTNFVANEHIDHTTVSITAGTGLKGGGTIASTRDLAIDSAELYSLYKHDDFSDFVADEHVAHSGVSITAGFGLKGGGTIASTRDLAIDSAELLTYYEPILRHDNLTGFVADEHVAHSGVSITAGFGLKGGGTIASTRDLAIDSAELLTYYEPILRHDNLSGFVANEHIDHTSVSITAGFGLKGGGTIASTRDLAIDSSELTTYYRPLIRSYLNVVDAGGDGSFAYDSTTGQFTYTGPSASEVRNHFAGGHGIDLVDGNISVDSSEVRGLFSGGGDLSYNSSTGEFSFDVEAVYTKENFDSDYFFAKDSANTAVERNQHDTTTKNFAVTVDSKTANHVYSGGSGNAYYIDGTESPIINLKLGRTYRFTLSSSDMSSHPFRFYYDAAKNTQYTTGVTTTSTYAEITITEATPPVLHYQCSSHGYMGHALQIGTRNFTGFTTTDLGEGSNLYFLNSRARSAISLGSAGSRNYNSSSGQITIPGTTDHITEGSNLFFTDARAQAVSLDSAEAIQLIDSAYVQARQLPSTDSAATQAMIDSNFQNTVTFGNDVIFDSAGAIVFDKSQRALRFQGSNNALFKAIFGTTSEGLHLYNTGPKAILQNRNSGGDLQLMTAGGIEFTDSASNVLAKFNKDHGKRLETTDSGMLFQGSILADSATFDIIRAAGLKFPTSDGLNNHVIRTDGNGNLSFASVTALSGNIDSAAVIQLIDSSYIQIRVPETYLATLIDSAYIAERTTAGTDSATTISLIESTVDSAYVALREANATGGGTTGIINNVSTSSFVGNNSTTAFTLAQTPSDSDDAFVFVNGLLQQTNTYSISGDVLTLDSAPDSDAEIEVRTHLLKSANLVLRDHKSYIYTLGTDTTTLSGNDSSGTSLTYDVGKVDVFVNGSRLVNGKDFTATTGTSIVFDSAFSAGNIVEVVSHSKATTTDLNGILSIDSDLTSTSANQIIYTYAAANHRTLKFTAQLEHDASSSYHAEEVLLTHNGTNVAMTTYAQVLMDSNLGTFDADINSGNVRVKFTPTKTNTSIKLRAIRTPA
tara:strand:+ start:1047 stop:6965 length:5919 start_codon:yes stop_codon:yes gene_type:complete